MFLVPYSKFFLFPPVVFQLPLKRRVKCMGGRGLFSFHLPLGGVALDSRSHRSFFKNQPFPQGFKGGFLERFGSLDSEWIRKLPLDFRFVEVSKQFVFLFPWFFAYHTGLPLGVGLPLNGVCVSKISTGGERTTRASRLWATPSAPTASPW